MENFGNYRKILVLLIKLQDQNSKWFLLEHSCEDKCVHELSVKNLWDHFLIEKKQYQVFNSFKVKKCFSLMKTDFTSNVVSTILSTELKYLVHSICVCCRIEKTLAGDTECNISGTWNQLKYDKTGRLLRVSIYIIMNKISIQKYIWPVEEVFHQLVSQPETSL